MMTFAVNIKATHFFDYFNRAKKEGLTDEAAYRWAITEDLYDANGVLLEPGEATANGMCYWHVGRPDSPERPIAPFCPVCGAVFYTRTPVKIPTRRENYDNFRH